MPRKRNPLRDRARELWEADKSYPLKSIAEELGVPEARVRKWKCEDKWERGEKGTFRNAKKDRTETRKLDRKLVAMVEENAELNDKQRAFCLHYVKSFNATRAYQKVYGCSYDTAMSEGWKAIRNPKIAEEIKRLKEARNLAMMADAEDVVLLHMRIAFADITDFVEFGRVEIPVMSMYGPVQVTDPVTGEKQTLMQEVNDVRFRESAEVDGRLIAKVQQGKSGASVELADRQKSLAFLERYFELNPMDRHRREFDLARLEMERRKQGEGEETEDDGFLAALKQSAKEVWRDEEGDLPV
ncbi:MAG: terminase small subunit [bacterium]|nr:terminase small subunit [bacterium]